MILSIDWVTAHLPFWGRFVNVHSSSYVSFVQPGCEPIGTHNFSVVVTMFSPWSILTNGHTFMGNWLLSFEIFGSINISRLSIVVIDEVLVTEVADTLVGELARCVSSFLEDFTVGSASTEVLGAVVVDIVIVLTSLDHVETPECSWNTWCVVISPVGGTVSYHHTLEVILGSLWWNNSVILDLVLLVGLVNLPGQVWNVDSSVGLTGEEQVISKTFWIADEELFNSLKKIFGLRHIVLSLIFSTASDGVSNTSWGLDVQHVGVVTP